MEQQKDFQEVDGPDQDLPVGGFRPAQNPELVKKPGLAEHLNDVAQEAAAAIQQHKAPAPDVDGEKQKALEKLAADKQELDKLGLEASYAEDAEVRRWERAQIQEKAAGIAAREAEYREKGWLPKASPEPEQEVAPVAKAPEQGASHSQAASPAVGGPSQAADPLGLGDIQKKPEHLFPEQPAQKTPEPEAPEPPKKRDIPKFDPPKTLLANPRNNKPHVKDYGDHIVVTRRAMFGVGKAAQAKREQAVTVGLQAAAERFGQPVRFEGNPAFLEETAKQAVKLGIKLEPGNRLAEAIYAKALDAREKELAIATKRDMVFSPSKEKEKTKEKGLGLSL